MRARSHLIPQVVAGATIRSACLLAVGYGLVGCVVGPDEDAQPADDSVDCTTGACGEFHRQAVAGVTYYSTGDTTQGWDIYDTTPAGAVISAVSDPDRGSVIHVVSDGTHNGFRLRKTDLQPWGNTAQFNLEWWQKFSTPFVVYVNVNTSGGQRYLTYTAADTDRLGTGQYIFHGLSSRSTDGAWHAFRRDLQADLKEAQPSLTLLSVNGFLVRGTGELDDIGLSAPASGGHASGSWTSLESGTDNPLFSCQDFAAVLGADGRIFAMGGTYNVFFGLNAGYEDVDIYNPSTDTWSTAAPMPTGRWGFGAAVATNGHIYVFGGDRGYYRDRDYHIGPSPLSTIEEYNPSTNTWTIVANMPTASTNLKAVATNGRIYVLDGRTVSAFTPSTKTWATVTTLPTDRVSYAVVAGGDGRIYVIGGDQGGGTQEVGTVEAYTPSTNTWDTVASMPTARYDLAAALGPDGKIYAIGGRTASPVGLGNVEVYTPSTNTWATAPSMPTPRHLFQAVAANGNIYAMGGAGFSVWFPVEVFTP